MRDVLRAPFRFFVDSEKTASLRAAVFCIPYQPSFPHLFLKIMSPGHLRSGHQSDQVTLPPKRFVMLQQLQFLSNHYETFGI